MDEPSMGLSPLYVSEIFAIIQEINKDGTTVLLVEQNAKKALSISNRAYVLETGNIVLEGDAKELMQNDQGKARVSRRVIIKLTRTTAKGMILMKLLTIGNSFADNSTRYIKEIFADRGVDLYVSRANIGGCSLERHWNGAANKIPDYPNGKTLDEMIEADVLGLCDDPAGEPFFVEGRHILSICRPI